MSHPSLVPVWTTTMPAQAWHRSITCPNRHGGDGQPCQWQGTISYHDLCFTGCSTTGGCSAICHDCRNDIPVPDVPELVLEALRHPVRAQRSGILDLSVTDLTARAPELFRLN